LAAPNAGYIKARLSNLKIKHADRDKAIKDMRELRFMRTNPQIPAAYESSSQKVRTPLIYDLITRVVSILAHVPPIFSVPELGPPGVEKERIEKLELWSNWLLPMLIRQTGRDFYRMFIDSLGAYGHGALKFLWAPDMWKGYPKRNADEGDDDYNKRAECYAKGAKLPFYCRDVHPLTIFPVFSETGLVEVFEVTDRERVDLDTDLRQLTERGGAEYKLGEAYPESGMPSYAAGSVTFIEHWTPRYLSYMVEDKIVFQKEHGYNQVPYFYAHGQGTCEMAPHEAGMSVAFALQDLVPLMDQLLTMLQNAVRLYSYPTPVSEFAPESIGVDRPKEMTFEPGKWHVGQPGEKMRFLEPPGVNADRAQLLGVISNMIDRAGISSVLAGISPGAQPVGYAINQLMMAAQSVYDPIVKEVCRTFGEMMPFAWQLVKTCVQETVYVLVSTDKAKIERKWVGLHPDEVADYRFCEVRMKPLIPSDHIMEGQFRIQARAAGYGEDDWVEEALGNDQPEITRQKRLVQDLLKEPHILQMLTVQAAREAGFTELLDEMGMSPQTPETPPPTGGMQGGGIPGGMQPPEGGAPTAPGQGLPLTAGAQPTRVRKTGGGRAAGAPRQVARQMEGV